MAKDARFFKFLDRSIKTKVIIENGEVVQAEGKCSIALHDRNEVIGHTPRVGVNWL